MNGPNVAFPDATCMTCRRSIENELPLSVYQESFQCLYVTLLESFSEFIFSSFEVCALVTVSWQTAPLRLMKHLSAFIDASVDKSSSVSMIMGGSQVPVKICCDRMSAGQRPLEAWSAATELN